MVLEVLVGCLLYRICVGERLVFVLGIGVELCGLDRLVLVTVHWRAFVSPLMNSQVPQKPQKFLISYVDIIV
jgi:hypothetical protein